VSGSISAYKIPELIRLLKKKGIRVIPVLSKSAHQFVTPLSIETLAEEKVWTDNDLMTSDMPHLTVSRQADIMLTAPCSANTLAKYSHGIADSLLTNCFLSFKKHQKHQLIAPAMHTEMWDHPSTKQNVRQLKSQGIRFIGPGQGALACGDSGEGRLVDLNYLVNAIQLSQYPSFSLHGKSILITAGGTSEPLDPVRVITNRSTGQLGHQLAIQSALAGANVQLITTTPFESDLPNISVISVTTAHQMSTAVNEKFTQCDRLYMVAAVSDFTHLKSKTKLRRQDNMTLTLTPTVDILKKITSIKTKEQQVIGFCLADPDIIKEVALEKMTSKDLDVIVANTAEAFGQSTRDIHIFKKGEVAPSWSGILGVDELCYKLLAEV
jgi:phosphopantothenoylcysteine decarboxylase/phosphopantothenate--cysteine ligase